MSDIAETASQAVPYGRRLRDLAEADPDRSALRFVAVDGTETTLTAAELDRRSNQVARALAARDYAAGDIVGLELRNSPELVLSVLGAWKLGVAPVPIRWDLPDWELARLQQIFADHTIIGPDPGPLLADAAGQSDAPLPDLVAPRAYGICSSGSTGTPKVIMVNRPTEYDPEGSAPLASTFGPVTTPQVVLVPAPMYHTNGFSGMMNLIAGDTVILLEKFDAARIVDLIERHRVTTFTAATTMLQRIANLPDITERDLSSIEWVLQGAAVIPPQLVRFWIDLIGAEHFFMAYGMTEGLGLCLIRGDEWLEHPGSVGKGIREAEIRVLDERGHDAPPGQVGEIYLRSPTTGMYEYLGRANPLPRTDDGFATAGDLGWLDGDGYLYIADRRVDMINTGGAKVFPAEVETALIDHPDVADVVVIGLADPEWGHRVHAIVEPTDHADPPTAESVIAFARGRLAAYKVPKTVEIIDAIPRSAATKVNRGALVAERGG